MTVGVRKAFVVFEAPGFDLHQSYSATLAPEVWAAFTDTQSVTATSASGAAGIGFSFAPLLKLKAALSAKRDRSNAAGVKVNASYPLIQPSNDGWTIGGETGDPRYTAATNSKTVGMLQGAYFRGSNGEQSDAQKFKDGSVIAGHLRHKQGANDMTVAAALYCAHDGLAVNLKFRNFQSDILANAEDSQVKKLKSALISICIAREIEGQDINGQRHQKSDRLNPDIFLARDEKRGRKPAGKPK